MIWTLGDSHAGHLQGLLYSIHDQTGVGVHLIATPGVSFPMLPNREFAPRKVIFQRIKDQMRSGDIVFVARLFLQRDRRHREIEDVVEWQEHLILLAKELSVRNVSVVVAGPPPIFDFDTINSCWMIFSNFSTCDVDRAVVAEGVDRVSQILRDAARQSQNILVFDQFEPICPSTQVRCTPLQNGRPMFLDKDHFNVYGAGSLANNFIALLKQNGILK